MDRMGSIAVVGAGAMGGLFGGRATEAGIRTTLLDTDRALVDHLTTVGLRLAEPGNERTITVQAACDCAQMERVDAVLFFVKCFHTRAAAELVRPLVDRGAHVVSLQNGWGNAETLASELDLDSMVAGVTYTSATLRAPGCVSSSGPARTVVGAYVRGGRSPNGSAGAAEAVARLLRSAGFPVETPEDVRTEIWRKLVLNAATLPTAALTGLAAGSLAALDAMHGLVDAAAGEAIQVGITQGYCLDLADELETIHKVLERAGSGKGSMLQDVEAGRRTEIDVISGAVLRAADEVGVKVPITRALYALVAGAEKARGLR